MWSDEACTEIVTVADCGVGGGGCPDETPAALPPPQAATMDTTSTKPLELMLANSAALV
jgi:hypothetical protein